MFLAMVVTSAPSVAAKARQRQLIQEIIQRLQELTLLLEDPSVPDSSPPAAPPVVPSESSVSDSVSSEPSPTPGAFPLPFRVGARVFVTRRDQYYGRTGVLKSKTGGGFYWNLLLDPVSPGGSQTSIRKTERSLLVLPS